MTAVLGSGIRSMSDSWISWNPRIDDPSNPSPSSNASSLSSCAGEEKCCIKPGQVAEAEVDDLDALVLDQPQHLVRGSFLHLRLLVADKLEGGR